MQASKLRSRPISFAKIIVINSFVFCTFNMLSIYLCISEITKLLMTLTPCAVLQFIKLHIGSGATKVKGGARRLRPLPRYPS